MKDKPSKQPVATQQREELVLHCSFCGLDNRSVEALIASADTGEPVHICNRCVTICVEVLMHQFPALARISFVPDDEPGESDIEH